MTDASLVTTFGRPWVSLLVAVVVGWLATAYAGRRIAHIPLGRLALGTALLTITAVAGARLHYVLAGSLTADLGTRLGDSGMHAGGGVIGLLLGLLLLRRLTGIPAAVLADVAAMGAGPALATYRLGCHVRGCCFGIPANLPWAVQHGKQSVAYLLHANARLIPPDAAWSAPMHPLPLYFAAVALIITAFGWAYYPRRRYDGEVALLSLLAFSISTLLLEPLRAAVPGQIRWASVPQLVWIAAGLCLASIVLLATVEAGRRRRLPYGRPATDR
jgi:phosphatidylglycerol:prolipoprotein diacylglycerol transferase